MAAEQDRIDAERYRWLRENMHYTLLIEGFDFTYSQVEHWSNEQNHARLDAAVDAARGANAAGVTGREVPSVPEKFVDMPKLVQDALLAYQARPCDPLAADLVRAVLRAYGVGGLHD